MKKVWICFLVTCMFTLTLIAAGYEPESFEDEETIVVEGERPLVDIEVSELTITITPEDFDDGRAAKGVDIYNEGNVPIALEAELHNVPNDLDVYVDFEYDYLDIGESTHLKVVIELSEQQVETSFEFTILIKATLEN